MPAIIHLSDCGEHTLAEILYHDTKYEVGSIMRAWVKHNKLEDITSLLIHDLNAFTPSGTLYYYKEKVDSEVALMMPTTPCFTTSGDTFNISYLNPNMIMMMKNLIILLMRTIGYYKQEGNI